MSEFIQSVVCYLGGGVIAILATAGLALLIACIAERAERRKEESRES